MSQIKENELNGKSKIPIQDNITPEERTHIDKLRSRMKGLMNEKFYEDATLFRRFLRARNFDINAAEEMLKNHLEWRKTNKIDTILTDYTAPEILNKYMAVSHFGYDKEGAPLIYVDFGNMDIRGMLQCIKPADIIRYMTWEFESDVRKMDEQSAKFGKTVEQFTYIFNLENFSLRTATHRQTLEMMAALVTVFDYNYPERLKNAFLLNGTFYFTLFWTLLSPFLSGATFKKVKIFGKDHWTEELLQHIDPDVLPAFLGGNRTDPDGDPSCRTFITYGQTVPKECYLTKSNDFYRQPGTKKLTVSRMAKVEVKLHVLYPDSKIEYEFDVKSKDISFSVLYIKEGRNRTKAVELIPKQRIQTDITSEAGVFACDNPGTYILQFDNTYSWIHQKEIYYTVTIVSPSKQKPLVG